MIFFKDFIPSTVLESDATIPREIADIMKLLDDATIPNLADIMKLMDDI